MKQRKTKIVDTLRNTSNFWITINVSNLLLTPDGNHAFIYEQK